jgi:hypothetical protein
VNQELRRRIIEAAIGILDEGDRLLAVPLDVFFEGNTDEQSMGVNVPAAKHPGLAGFRRLLEEIRDRGDVQEIFIELTEIPLLDDEEEKEMWPIASVAFVITSAPLAEVRSWVKPLHPRDVSEGWNVQAGVKTPLTERQLQTGMRPVRIWLL